MIRLIEWDSLELRVSGEKLAAIAKPILLGASAELEAIDFQFTNGMLRIEGFVRKLVRIRFTVEIPRIEASGLTVRVALQNATALGIIPIPSFLFKLIEGKLPRDLVRLEQGSTFVVALDRFLPSFVEATIQQVWIVDGGLAVTLGRGGADLPPDSKGEPDHGSDTPGR
jgi:hypothetical protein